LNRGRKTEEEKERILRKGKILDTVEKRKVNIQDHFSERKNNTEQEKRKNVQKGGK
jgi:hypothetical protein